MSAKTDQPASVVPGNDAPAPRKPRVALFIATAGGLGYIPVAPGTWGSLAGLGIYFLALKGLPRAWAHEGNIVRTDGEELIFGVIFAVLIVTAVAGTYTSHRVMHYAGLADPQYVVIDEVSGQILTFALALAPANWKYLLLGLILFRVFDIWKPFPARQAESLPAGWGIMADDWVAGVYAAICLWLARAAGL